MSDICERLQVCVDSEDGYWPTILAKEAIKEIRRLREEVTRWENGCKAESSMNAHYINKTISACKECTKLRDEVETYKQTMENEK